MAHDFATLLLSSFYYAKTIYQHTETKKKKTFFFLEHSQYDESLVVLQSKLADQVNSASRLSDACALLWSLRMSSQIVDNAEFTQLLTKVSDKITDHGCAYFATHFAAALLGAEDYSGYNTFRHSVNNFTSKYKEHDIVKKYEDFGLSMMDSVTAYSLDDYSLATDKVYSVQVCEQFTGLSFQEKLMMVLPV